MGSLVFGLAPNIEIAFVGRVLVGFGVSMVFIPTMKILSQWFRATEFAMMAGILNAVGGVGVMGATWMLAAMTAGIGWRLSFDLIGACTFIIVVLVWLIVRDRPADKGWPSPMEIDAAGSMPPAMCGRKPAFFIMGMVNAPVETTLAMALPEIEPNIPEAITATLAGPPILCPTAARGKSMKNFWAPLFSRNAPNRTNKST